MLQSDIVVLTAHPAVLAQHRTLRVLLHHGLRWAARIVSYRAFGTLMCHFCVPPDVS